MTAERWDSVYTEKGATNVSWYEQTPDRSVRLVAAAVSAGCVVDVGAGASRLADELVGLGYEVTVLDISAASLDVVRSRLGNRVTYVVADLLCWEPAGTYDVWHDRAVFHFLTDPRERAGYVALAGRTVRSGGALVLGTFAPDGPESCSGLPTARYSAEAIAEIFGADFTLVGTESAVHETPWHSTQSFTWVTLRRGVWVPGEEQPEGA